MVNIVGSRVLLVGVWGFPGNWCRARYLVPTPSGGVGGWHKAVYWFKCPLREYLSHSTTSAIARALVEAGFEVRVVVFGLDTLASPGKVRIEQIPEYDVKRRRLAEKVNVLIDEFLGHDPKNYEEVLKRGERVLNLFLKGEGEVKGYFEGLEDNVEGYILPGVANFYLGGRVTGKLYRYVGSPMNTLVALEYIVFKKLLDYKPDAVILDISHGINYLPTIAYHALSRCVIYYSALEDKEIVSLTVNSDPIIDYDQLSRIHIIEARKVKAKCLELLAEIISEIILSEGKVVLYHMLERKHPSEPLRKFSDFMRKIVDLRGPYLTSAKSIRGAFQYGLVLYMVNELAKLDPQRMEEDSKDIMEKVYSLLKQRSVKVKDKDILISYDFAFEARNILNIVYMLLLLCKATVGCKKIVSSDGFVELDQLEKYAKTIGISGPALTLFEREVSDIKKRIKAYKSIVGGARLREPRLYFEVHYVLEQPAFRVIRDRAKTVIGEVEALIPKHKCKVDKRNFLAHAGFERNVLLVKVEDNKIFVKYVEECEKAIKSIIKEIA